jgi:manganese/zinc/iron transport system permease protein
VIRSCLSIAVLLLMSPPTLGAEFAVDAGAFDPASLQVFAVFEWPTAAEWNRVLSLRDSNTRVVVQGTMLLGLAAGVIGSFTLLRRRSLMGDALSHATLPGVGLAYMLAPLVGLEGKSLPVLLFGAVVSGVAGIAAILYVRHLTRLKEDAALGIVLSVFFGAGIAVLTVAQKMETGHAAGLETFIYGKAASMIESDIQLIWWSGLISVLVAVALFRELSLLCFDEGFAQSQGYPVLFLDLILMTLVILVTIIGLQAVGSILVIALLIIPAAAARFWTLNLKRMVLISAAIGSCGGLLGSLSSALFRDLPSGAMIVLVCSILFFLSMTFGTSRGLLVRWLRRRRLNRSIDRQHLLRGLFEIGEARLKMAGGRSAASAEVVTTDELLAHRIWSSYRLRREIRRCRREGLVLQTDDGHLQLTALGHTEAARLAHEHRLWEIYLITHAEVAAARVDQSADAIEHVLEPELIAQLETLLRQRRSESGVVPSPHPLDVSGVQS